jgi:hypothetical protein
MLFLLKDAIEEGVIELDISGEVIHKRVGHGYVFLKVCFGELALSMSKSRQYPMPLHPSAFILHPFPLNF